MSAVDLSEFEALSRPQKKACSIGKALDSMGPKTDDGVKLTAACARASDEITNAAIRDWLTARGIDGIHVNQVSSHRKGTCSCAQA